MTTTPPPPTWDEDAIRAEVMSSPAPANMTRLVTLVVDTTLAVVRRYLPVKPSRETIARLLDDHGLMHSRCRCGFDPRLDANLYAQHVADVLLAEWPGESRAGTDGQR